MPTPRTHRAPPLAIIILLLAALLLTALPAHSQPGAVHLALGNPSQAVADPAQPANYLISRDQYALSYHRDRGTPNWASWHLELADLGTVDRSNFTADTSLPAGWYRPTPSDYLNTGYDRGHMVPSADRNATVPDNEATFLMSNIIPQAPDNNQGVWGNLEEHSRDLVRQGSELYIVAGVFGSAGTIASGKITVPASVWKAILVLPAGDDDLSRVSAETPVIAVRIPNINGVNADWNAYTTSVDCIERVTGYDLFSAVPDEVEAVIEASGPGCERIALPLLATEVVVVPPADVQIAEVLADPPGDDLAGEYVLLRNQGAGPADLAGWTLSDAANNTYTFPAFTLAPGAEVRVWVRAGADDATNLYWGRGSAVWNNSGDTATLRDASGILIDTLTY